MKINITGVAEMGAYYAAGVLKKKTMIITFPERMLRQAPRTIFLLYG